ncbi:MAG TPA: HDOD domain-containing protein [Polyangiaceae bacterium]|nr:HDOD domain-containing protein [Polyangiaceae bacterium]
MPAVVTELRELVQKSDSRIDTIVTLLERDPALVARVLLLGRSAQFARSGTQGTPDLHFIINRVGFRQLSNVVETVWSNDCFAVADERYHPIVARMTRLSVARAVSMRALAERLRIEVFPAYLAGLFADVGATFLLWAIVDKSRGHVPEPADALAFVREHHETMSGAVLKRWGHQELVVGLVRRHHNPLLTGPGAVYGGLSVLASQMARELTGEDDLTCSEPFPPAPLFERCVALIGLGDAARSGIFPRVKDEYAAALDAFGTPAVPREAAG